MKLFYALVLISQFTTRLHGLSPGDDIDKSLKDAMGELTKDPVIKGFVDAKSC
jgi:hypothetical protein